MGLGEIFADNAQFPNIIDGIGNLTISKIVQKSTIEINEEGDEASTDTGRRIRTYCIGNTPNAILLNRYVLHLRVQHTTYTFLVEGSVQNDSDRSRVPKTFKADHPFLFLLMITLENKKNDVLLFMGKVSMPELAD